jgi:hypothetical protein
MVANRWLAELYGIDEDSIQEIDKLHEQLACIISKRVGLGYSESIYNHIEDMEYKLQSLWCFPQDCGYHKYKHTYKFKCQWIGRVFQCIATGELFTIPDDVEERACYFWGDGAMIDVGRLDMYSRVIGNVEEAI